MLNLVGQRFGMLIVKAEGARTPGGGRTWTCLCDCGGLTTTRQSNLRNGHTSSCGCFRSVATTRNKTRHGMSQSPEHKIWRSMLTRCSNPNEKVFEHYGGRGIAVCERWQIFENFYADMGPRPSPAHSIDRRDNNGNYEPGNCRWATRTEQGNNRRANRVLTINGRTKTSTEWARDVGLSPLMVAGRLHHGWTPEEAVFTPPRGKRSGAAT
jgi:hypothetical protein